MRIDQLLVSRGLVPSRSAAQRLIDGGAVRWRANDDWCVARKAGDDVPDGSQLEITDDAELRWVSRGGLKLDGALGQCGIDVRGRICLDVGQGRGGFTEVLLARGAARVVGVEVGHDQLHPRLRSDPRVHALEGVNARHLTRERLGGTVPPTGFDLISGDLSFISLALVIPALEPLLAPAGELLLLVKPQFELQPAQIGKGGIVKSPAFYADVEARLREACTASGLRVQQWLPSPIAGGDGNREFFIRAVRAARREEQSHV